MNIFAVMLIENPEFKYAVEVLKNKGWSGIEDFYSQPMLTQAYSVPLFPIEISSVERKGDKYYFVFNITNNLDTILSVSITGETIFDVNKDTQGMNFEWANIIEKSNKKLTVILPVSTVAEETKYLFKTTLEFHDIGRLFSLYLVLDVSNIKK